ncbi:hypothetical protein B566_EDAN012878 [Ephemera danica]|nr:hypothetical protein B566_EDAN012878 [Ephemera danica]
MLKSCVSTRRDVLNLYRSLLRYGKSIKLTEKNYYKGRIRAEFETNKNIENPADIKFHIEVQTLDVLAPAAYELDNW